MGKKKVTFCSDKRDRGLMTLTDRGRDKCEALKLTAQKLGRHKHVQTNTHTHLYGGTFLLSVVTLCFPKRLRHSETSHLETIYSLYLIRNTVAQSHFICFDRWDWDMFFSIYMGSNNLIIDLILNKITSHLFA